MMRLLFYQNNIGKTKSNRKEIKQIDEFYPKIITRHPIFKMIMQKIDIVGRKNG